MVVFISHYPFSIGFGDSITNSLGNSLDSVARHGVRCGGKIPGMLNGTIFLGTFVGTFGEWLWGAFVGFVKVTVVSIIIPGGIAFLLYGILCLICTDRQKTFLIMDVVALVFCGVMVYKFCCLIPLIPPIIRATF